VLECYWLARQYHQPPDVFLSMPLDEMLLHVRRTEQLLEAMKPPPDPDDNA
jgi:hypothetical protein